MKYNICFYFSVGKLSLWYDLCKMMLKKHFYVCGSLGVPGHLSCPLWHTVNHCPMMTIQLSTSCLFMLY